MDLEAAAEIERLRAALAAENEACAKIAETLPFPIQFYSGMETAALARKRIARAIRARLQDGETK